MAKFYSGIDTSVGIGSETLDSMLANGNTYGISPSKDIDCENINSTGIHTVGSQIKFSESGSLLIKESDETDYNWTKGIQVGYDGTGDPSPILMFAYNNNGYISDRGNELRITSDSSPIRIRTLNYGGDPEVAGEMAVFNPGGSVDLYHQGDKKFETTSAGAKVTSGITFNPISIDDRNALGAPVGTVIFNSDTNKLQVRTPSGWVDLH
tara:strand:- start:377 stop:1003 length:627 start_codon:yes stop_codon:yes gene_type:complete